MQEIFITQENVEDVFAEVADLITTYETGKILISHAVQGRPIAKTTEEYLYITALPEDDEISNFINRVEEATVDEEGTKTLNVYSQVTEVFNIRFIAYGPNSFDKIRRLKTDLLRSDVKTILDKEHIFLIPDEIGPMTPLNENFNAQWYKRCDLELKVSCTKLLLQESAHYEDYVISVKEG